MDPFLDKLLEVLGGVWPGLLIITVGWAALGLTVYQRRHMDGVWDRAYIQVARELASLGIEPTADDTVATIRAKIAERRQQR